MQISLTCSALAVINLTVHLLSSRFRDCALGALLVRCEILLGSGGFTTLGRTYYRVYRSANSVHILSIKVDSRADHEMATYVTTNADRTAANVVQRLLHTFPFSPTPTPVANICMYFKHINVYIYVTCTCNWLWNIYMHM